MSTKVEELYKTQYLDMYIKYERQCQENAAILKTMEVLKEVLEEIADLTTGESSRIACEVLDSIYPIKGA